MDRHLPLWGVDALNDERPVIPSVLTLWERIAASCSENVKRAFTVLAERIACGGN
jgi:hypothetical protein